ncbi:MAG: GreA/GreB family elongation factor [Candidatus Nealsonbacteria bacterium]|nr:GreA/GreB family elongation factor [Candidatus Nealsonbacteria bacterium]
MNQKRKKILLNRLEKYLVQLQENTDRSQKTLQYYAEQALSSWSIAGERKHAETELKLTQDLLEKAQLIRREVASSSEASLVRAFPPCFVVITSTIYRTSPPAIELEDSKKKDDRFYFLEAGSQIPGLKMISLSSPLGQAILNKRMGERFSCEVGTATISGTIKRIE